MTRPGPGCSGDAEIDESSLPEASARASVVFEGLVLEPAGAPAEGAVVVSSAGGRAVTNAAGGYRLEVEVPLEATSVQLTAVGSGGGNRMVSASVPLGWSLGAIRVGPLPLALVNSCSPSWLPTFGAGTGLVRFIDALAVYDDDAGPALYAGGSFSTDSDGAADPTSRSDSA